MKATGRTHRGGLSWNNHEVDYIIIINIIIIIINDEVDCQDHWTTSLVCPPPAALSRHLCWWILSSLKPLNPLQDFHGCMFSLWTSTRCSPGTEIKSTPWSTFSPLPGSPYSCQVSSSLEICSQLVLPGQTLPKVYIDSIYDEPKHLVRMQFQEMCEERRLWRKGNLLDRPLRCKWQQRWWVLKSSVLILHTFQLVWQIHHVGRNHIMQMLFQYDNDLYFLAPFYHLAFPLLDSLIIVDIDLEFRCNKILERRRCAHFLGAT